MCGIVGYIGKKDCTDILLDGLSMLEYRGYDSAGILTINNTGISLCKTKGRVSELIENSKKMKISGTLGIGHTRWATHGEPSNINSHPHLDYTNTIGVVHNGIIENYLEIKDRLVNLGCTFVSGTDTEVIPNLIKQYYTGDLLKAVQHAILELKGSYAIAVVSKDNPDEIVVARKDSPLVIGKGDDEYYIASDIPALLKHTKMVYILEDNDTAKITRNGIEFYNKSFEKIEKECKEIDWSIDAAEKSGFDDFMLKEIFEQPTAVNQTVLNRLNIDLLSEINMDLDYALSIEKIYIVACGTAMHAGLTGKNIIEKLTRIPVEVDVASEFRYRDPIITQNTLLITISQSGETADTLAALRLAKEHNAKTLAITNVVGSTISREADYVMYTHAGPEIAVASTKAYNTQLAAICIFAINIAKIYEYKYYGLDEDLKAIPDKIAELLKSSESIKEIAKQIYKEQDIFFLGRGIDYPVSMEGSLKMKEITYIHSEAYPSGELKHGPIALIEKNIFVITTVTDESLLEKSLSNIQEVKTRGAKVIVISNLDIDQKYYDYIIQIPKCPIQLSPMLTVVPLQLLAYYVSKFKNLDVDKPRNLAKSVTVE